MTKLIFACAWLCAMAFAVAATNPAEAAGSNTVSFVSNTGSNGHNCSTPALACADFATALINTAEFGEIDCLTGGNYNPVTGVTIAQSVTIDCAGAVGSVVLSTAGTSGIIVVNAPGIVVRLRNLTFNRESFGVGGIDAKNMSALYVENCVITNANNVGGSGFGPFTGIKFEPSANAQLFVSNSIISNNGNSASGITGGIYVLPAAGVTAHVSIDHSQINGNTFGIAVDGASGGIVHGVVKDSVVSGNSQNGITAHTSSSSVWLLVDETSVSGNEFGLVAGGSGAAILARNSSVVDNTTGLFTNSSGALYTYGNNSVNGNATNGTFTATASLQ